MKMDILPGDREFRKTAGIASAALVLPFLILESVNSPNFPRDFPVVLFGVMWLMVMSLAFIALSLLRRLETGGRTTGDLAGLLWRVAALIVIAWMLVSLIVDQMPCFVGVPNCD